MAHWRTRFEIGDAMTYTREAHSVKFGGSLYHLRQTFVVDSQDPASVIFPNLSAFLGRQAVNLRHRADGSRPSAPPGFTTSANLPVFESLTRYRNGLTHDALFAQDQWRLNPRWIRSPFLYDSFIPDKMPVVPPHPHNAASVSRIALQLARRHHGK